MKDAPFPPNYLWFVNRSLCSELARISTEDVEYDAPTLVRTHGLATFWFQLGSNFLKLANKLELNWFHVGGKAPRVSEMYIDGQ